MASRDRNVQSYPIKRMVFLSVIILACATINIIFLFLLLDIQNRVPSDDASYRVCHIASSALMILLAIDYIHVGFKSSLFSIELFFYYFLSISIHYISAMKLYISPESKVTYKLILPIAMATSIILLIIWLEKKIPITGLPIKHNERIFLVSNFISIVVPGISTSFILTMRIYRLKQAPSLEDMLTVSRGTLSAVSAILVQLSSERIYEIFYALLVISYTLGILSVVVLNDNQYYTLLRSSRSNRVSNATNSWDEYVKSRKKRRATITNTVAAAAGAAKNINSPNRESKGWIHYTPIVENKDIVN